MPIPYLPVHIDLEYGESMSSFLLKRGGSQRLFEWNSNADPWIITAKKADELVVPLPVAVQIIGDFKQWIKGIFQLYPAIQGQEEGLSVTFSSLDGHAFLAFSSLTATLSYDAFSGNLTFLSFPTLPVHASIATYLRLIQEATSWIRRGFVPFSEKLQYLGED